MFIYTFYVYKYVYNTKNIHYENSIKHFLTSEILCYEFIIRLSKIQVYENLMEKFPDFVLGFFYDFFGNSGLIFRSLFIYVIKYK